MITAKDAGDFGAVTITQSVTIDGSNISGISYTGTGGGSVIAITASATVILQNLAISGMGTAADGIDVVSGGIVIVDNCKIMSITGYGIEFTGPGNLTVENSRIESLSGTIGVNYPTGINIVGTAAENVVVRNTVIDASPVSEDNFGFVMHCGGGAVQTSMQNVTIMGAGQYAVLASCGITQITGSVLTQSGAGVTATNGATISVASSMITANTTGVCSEASSKIRLDNNDIYDNTTAIANCGGIVKTSTTNKTSGTIAVPAADISNSVTF